MLLVHYSSMLYAEQETGEEAPAADFIEFLGEWETSEGEWIDPNELATEAYADAYAEQEQEAAVEKDDE